MTSFASYLLISCALLYAFAYPFWTEVSMKLEEKDKYKGVIENVNIINQKKSEIISKMNAISEIDKKKIDNFMPNSLDFVKLTSDINAVGSKYGISIDKVSSIQKDKSVGNSINEAESQKLYNTASISFTFQSSYSNFLKFVNDIEKSLRILDIKSISMNSVEGGNYDFRLELDTYWIE